MAKLLFPFIISVFTFTHRIISFSTDPTSPPPGEGFHSSSSVLNAPMLHTPENPLIISRRKKVPVDRASALPETVAAMLEEQFLRSRTNSADNLTLALQEPLSVSNVGEDHHHDQKVQLTELAYSPLEHTTERQTHMSGGSSMSVRDTHNEHHHSEVSVSGQSGHKEFQTTTTSSSSSVSHNEVSVARKVMSKTSSRSSNSNSSSSSGDLSEMGIAGRF